MSFSFNANDYLNNANGGESNGVSIFDGMSPEEGIRECNSICVDNIKSLFELIAKVPSMQPHEAKDYYQRLLKHMMNISEYSFIAGGFSYENKLLEDMQDMFKIVNKISKEAKKNNGNNS